MKLALKLGLVIFACIVGVAIVNASVRVHQSLALIDDEAREELLTVASTLRPIFVHHWMEESPSEALTLLEHAGLSSGEGGGRVEVHWRSLGELQAEHVIWPEERADLAAGRPVVRRARGDVDQLSLWMPLDPEVHDSVLVVTRPLPEEQATIRAVVATVVWTNLVLIAVLEAMVLAAGRLLLGQPLDRLIELTRRIAKGDLEVRVPIDSKDELGEVAAEMNAMADALKQSQARVAAEHRATLAAVEELRHADRLATVGELAAGVAHELGTPLTVVGYHAKQIERQAVSGAEAVKGAAVIVRQVEKIAAIVRQLMSFSRRGAAHKATGDLAALAKQTLELLKPMADKRGVTVRFEAPPSPQLAEFEPNQLEQALTNLVVNGLQSMKAGGSLTVAVHRERAEPPKKSGLLPGEYLSISVADQGVGIPNEALDRVFDPFFTTKPVGEGTGLGLSVAYGIVEDHGGWIDVSSAVGTGSRFALHLPPAR